MPPCFLLRDWYESGKSDHRDQAFILPYLSNPVSPFHGEPLQLVGLLCRYMKCGLLTKSLSKFKESQGLLRDANLMSW
jgi:hypothetical protein